jgi:hypothetical protein
MSAKEMFEELGYEYERQGKDIYCEKEFPVTKARIYFCDRKRTIDIATDEHITFDLDLQELQAINKQIEELGWNNE